MHGVHRMINILSAALIVLLLIGAGTCGKGSYNEDYLAPKQSKAVRGVAAIFILFHHLSFKICVGGAFFIIAMPMWEFYV